MTTGLAQVPRMWIDYARVLVHGGPVSKKNKKESKAKRRSSNVLAPGMQATVGECAPFRADGRLRRNAYEGALFDLHVELVKLQGWVKERGAKICILFEGRDGAGRGGTIKAITERVSPRVFRVVALP